MSAEGAQKKVIASLHGARALTVPLEDIEVADAEALSSTTIEALEAYTEDQTEAELLGFMD